MTHYLQRDGRSTSAATDDGGPKFPGAFDHPAGMSLRDYVAVQAPITLHDAALVCGWDGLKESNPNHDTSRAVLFAIMATIRYEYADAFLAARSDQRKEVV